VASQTIRGRGIATAGSACTLSMASPTKGDLVLTKRAEPGWSGAVRQSAGRRGGAMPAECRDVHFSARGSYRYGRPSARSPRGLSTRRRKIRCVPSIKSRKEAFVIRKCVTGSTAIPQWDNAYMSVLDGKTNLWGDRRPYAAIAANFPS